MVKFEMTITRPKGPMPPGGLPGDLPGGHGQSGQRKRRVDGEAHQAQAQQQQRMQQQQQQRKKGRTT